MLPTTHYLHQQTLTVTLGSGAKVRVNAETLARFLAKAIPQSSPQPVVAYAEHPNTLMLDTHHVELQDLCTLPGVEVSPDPTHQDYLDWALFRRAPLGTWATKITLHLSGLPVDEQVQVPQPCGLTSEAVADIQRSLGMALDLLKSEPARVESLLLGLSVALNPYLPKDIEPEFPTVTEPVVPAPPSEDGWGHTSKDASLPELLREGLAAEQGTDNHEQVLQQLLGDDNIKGTVEMLYGKLKELQAEVRHLQRGRLDDLKRLFQVGVALGKRTATLDLTTQNRLRLALEDLAHNLRGIGIDPKNHPDRL